MKKLKIRMRRKSNRVLRSSYRVRRYSNNSASACCTEGPGSISGLGPSSAAAAVKPGKTLEQASNIVRYITVSIVKNTHKSKRVAFLNVPKPLKNTFLCRGVENALKFRV